MCSCNGMNRTASFSPRNDTWSKASDLNPTSWNPYPELMSKKDCYGNNPQGCQENYGNEGEYLVQTETVPNIVPKQTYGTRFNLNTNYIVGITPMSKNAMLPSKEGYGQDLPCCRPGTTFDKLQTTWKLQPPFTL